MSNEYLEFQIERLEALISTLLRHKDEVKENFVKLTERLTRAELRGDMEVEDLKAAIHKKTEAQNLNDKIRLKNIENIRENFESKIKEVNDEFEESLKEAVEQLEQSIEQTDECLDEFWKILRRNQSETNDRLDKIESTLGKLLPYNFDETKPSNPNSASSAHTAYRQFLDLVGSHLGSSQDTEKHQPHDLCNREKDDPHTPCTSHCKSCDSSLNTSDLIRKLFHQTNNEARAFEQLLSLILSTIWGQRGTKYQVSGLSQVLSFLSSSHEPECHVAQYGGHIRIQFRDGSHPESERSELILLQSSHSS